MQASRSISGLFNPFFRGDLDKPKNTFPVRFKASPIYEKPRLNWTEKMIKKFSPFKYCGLFKIGLYQLIIKIISIKTGLKLEEMILYSLKIFPKEKHEKITQEKSKFLKQSRCASSVSFETEDGAILDGVTFKVNHSNKWLIAFHGNSMCYEQRLNELERQARRLGVNILTFNYRGVGLSEGHPHSFEDLFKDGEAAIQYLQKKEGAGKIHLEGFSLGGVMATYCAVQHPECSLSNLMSLSSIGNVVEAMAFKQTNDKKISQSIGWIASNILKEMGWEVDCAKKWLEVKGKKWMVSATKDEVIIGMGQLFKALKQQLGYQKVDKQDANNSEQMEKNKAIKQEILHIKSIGTTHNQEMADGARNAHFDKLVDVFKR